MAQILVKARSSWMEKVDRSGWDQDKLDKYNKRTRKGSPIVVMPDDHIWGSSEGPLGFIIIKVNDITVEEVRVYLESEFFPDNPPEIDPQFGKMPIKRKIKFKRRFHIPEIFVDQIIAQGGEITINKNTLLNNIKDRRSELIDG